MHVTLLLPGSLLPREVVGALKEPLARTALAALLLRAELVGDSESDAPAHLAWLAEHLFRHALPLPTAPYAYAALSGGTPPGDAVLWHADPVHLEVARDHLVLTPLPAPPTHEEATDLIASADALLEAVEARFVRSGEHWFLRAPRLWDLNALPLHDVVGQPLHTLMPEGEDASMWTRLLTEIQMTWHSHPVNEARESRGVPTVNSLWLHGGGTWSPLPPGRYTALLANAPEWRGAATAAGLPSPPADAPPSEGALAVWTELLAPRRLQDWGSWIGALAGLDERLASLGTSTTVDLILTGRTIARRLRTRPSDRLKFWRTRSLEQVLSE